MATTSFRPAAGGMKHIAAMLLTALSMASCGSRAASSDHPLPSTPAIETTSVPAGSPRPTETAGTKPDKPGISTPIPQQLPSPPSTTVAATVTSWSALPAGESLVGRTYAYVRSVGSVVNPAGVQLPLPMGLAVVSGQPVNPDAVLKGAPAVVVEVLSDVDESTVPLPISSSRRAGLLLVRRNSDSTSTVIAQVLDLQLKPNEVPSGYVGDSCGLDGSKALDPRVIAFGLYTTSKTAASFEPTQTFLASESGISKIPAGRVTCLVFQPS